MTRPLPGYLPSGVREIILSRYPGGIKALAEKVGQPYVTILHTFKINKHVSLKKWLEFCDTAGIDADEVVADLSLPVDKRKPRLLERFGVATVIDALERFSDERSYVYRLLAGNGANKIVDIYAPIARALNLSLAEFDHYLTRPQ